MECNPKTLGDGPLDQSLDSQSSRVRRRTCPRHTGLGLLLGLKVEEAAGGAQASCGPHVMAPLLHMGLQALHSPQEWVQYRCECPTLLAKLAM